MSHSIPQPLTQDPFTARLTEWTISQRAFLDSISDWEHAQADMPSLDSHYVSEHEHIMLGHRLTADVQRALDGENLVALVCGYR